MLFYFIWMCLGGRHLRQRLIPGHVCQHASGVVPLTCKLARKAITVVHGPNSAETHIVADAEIHAEKLTLEVTHVAANIRSHLQQWSNGMVGETPNVKKAKVIVTILEKRDNPPGRSKREPSFNIAGKGRILGDIISPAASVEDWNCAK